MNHAPLSDELLAALIDALDHLDSYLMANWDDVQRRRVRERFSKINTLLQQERKSRRSTPPTSPESHA